MITQTSQKARITILGIVMMFLMLGCGGGGDPSIPNDPPIWTNEIGIMSVTPADRSVTVTFGTASDPEGHEPVTYTLYYSCESFSGNNNPFAGALVTKEKITSPYIVTNLANGQKYWFGVRARDSKGKEDENTIKLSATPIEGVNNPPIWNGSVGIQSVDPKDEAIVVSFGTAMDPDNDNPVTYTLFYIDETLTGENDPFKSSDIREVITSPCVLTNLSNGHNYWIGVRAKDAKGLMEQNLVKLSATPIEESGAVAVAPVVVSQPDISNIAPELKSFLEEQEAIVQRIPGSELENYDNVPVFIVGTPWDENGVGEAIQSVLKQDEIDYFGTSSDPIEGRMTLFKKQVDSQYLFLLVGSGLEEVTTLQKMYVEKEASIEGIIFPTIVVERTGARAPNREPQWNNHHNLSYCATKQLGDRLKNYQRRDNKSYTITHTKLGHRYLEDPPWYEIAQHIDYVGSTYNGQTILGSFSCNSANCDIAHTGFAGCPDCIDIGFKRILGHIFLINSIAIGATYAPQNAQEQYREAKKAFENKEDGLGFYYLALASHYIEDCGNPLHTGPTNLQTISEIVDYFLGGNDHEAYENYVRNNWSTLFENELKNVGIKDVSSAEQAAASLAYFSAPHFTDLETAWDWQMMDYVNDITIGMLQETTRIVSGFYKLALDEIGVPEPTNSKPIVSIINCPGSPLQSTTSSYEFQWSMSDLETPLISQLKVEIKRDTGNWEPLVDGTTNYTWIGFDYGNHTFQVKATDNGSPPLSSDIASCTFTRSSPPTNQEPSVSITNCPSSPLSSTTSSYNFQWSMSDLETPISQLKVEIKKNTGNWESLVDGTTNYTWSGFDYGNHTFQVKVTDNGSPPLSSDIASCTFTRTTIDPQTDARIDSYIPSSKIEVTRGTPFTLRVFFTNTGNVAANFWSGVTIWNSSGQEVYNSYGQQTYLNVGQQGSNTWTPTINTTGEYWIQFGIWDEAKTTLFDREPSPSQNLIRVVEPQTILARIDSYSPSIKIDVTRGSPFTIRVFFTNIGNVAAYFWGGVTIWNSSGNPVFDSFGQQTYLNVGQQGSNTWTPTINTTGEYWIQFGVWDEAKTTLFDREPSPSQNLIRIVEPQTISARIDSYIPSSKIDVTRGTPFTIKVFFTNTGNVAANFWGGVTIWNSSGNPIFDSFGQQTYLNVGQQGNNTWTPTINTPGEYWIQFGVWDETRTTLLDRKPSPSQNLIRIVEPQTISARIDSYIPSSKIDVTRGTPFTIKVFFTNTGNVAANFWGGVTIWNSSGQEVYDSFGQLTYLGVGQQGINTWTPTINTPGEYWIQFGVWNETRTTLLDKKPSPSQNLIKVVDPSTISARIDTYFPSSKIEVDRGEPIGLWVLFTNTGNVAANFWGGVTIWNSSGQEVYDSFGQLTYLGVGQQGINTWTPTINTPGEYWIQFGVWNETRTTLLDKKPSPSQNLIKVR